MRSLVLSADTSVKFDDPTLPEFDQRDRDIALGINSVPFAIRAMDEGGLLVARPQQQALP